MNDVMVSVRMPKSLALELKELVRPNHFLDLSEEVRGIVREKWVSAINPELFEIKKLRENIEAEIRKKSTKKIEEEVAKEREKIKSQLKDGGFSNAQ